MMSLERWTKDESGNLIAHPLTGFEPIVYAGMGILLRLEFALDGDRIDNPSGNTQVAMSREGAELLVRKLTKAIEQTNRPPSGPRN